jgi:hypothetical protein
MPAEFTVLLYAPTDLDIMSRAFHAAIDSIAAENRDMEAAKAAAMNGILDAARRGERNAERLTISAIESIRICEEYGIEPELRAAAL